MSNIFDYSAVAFEGPLKFYYFNRFSQIELSLEQEAVYAGTVWPICV